MIQRAKTFAGRDLLFLGILSAAAFAVGLREIYNYGYIGQDFIKHRNVILSFPGSYSYAETNPPGLYLFASFVRHHVSSAHYLEAVALAFLSFNTLALWIIYWFLWRGISLPALRYSAALFVTFVPFRVIHSVVIAADAFTLPVFALVALFTLRLLGNPRSYLSWAAISVSLCAGMLCKYTFAGLLPPVALLLAIGIWRSPAKGGRLRWGAVGVMALALPAGLLAFQLRECERANGVLTNGQWPPKGTPPAMRWSDILTLQRSDLALLSAPEFAKGELFGFRSYSYPGLLHVSSVTDILGFSQPPPATLPRDWDRRTQEAITRTRSTRSQVLQEASVRWCIVYSALAVVGSLYCLCLSALSLPFRKPYLPEETVVITALAAGFYAPIFLNLHRVAFPYLLGYWLPRLVLPALVVFYGLGFVLLDLAARNLERPFPGRNLFLYVFAGYTLVACLLFVGFLT